MTGELKLTKFRSTTIFTKDKVFILSPAISNDSNWFDLRKVNIDKYTEKYNKGFLLIRFKNQLLLTALTLFLKNMISDDKFANSKNSGIHWKFVISSKSDKKYSIENLTNGKHFDVFAMDRVEITKLIND